MNNQQTTEEETLEKELTKLTKNKPETKPNTTPSPSEGFNPEKTFYDSATGKYITDVGQHYRTYGRKKVLQNGVIRHFEQQGIEKDIQSVMDSIELDRAIDAQGSLAGYPRGLQSIRGKSYLVIDEPKLKSPEKGTYPCIESILQQAFPESEAKDVFLSWLRDGVEAVRKSHHHPAPMLVMAGERKAGKSLIAYIVQHALGGRASNPMAIWSGKTIWNNDLLGAELLLIDDSEASTDIRARKSMGANFKESIYGGSIKIQTRNQTAIDMRPVWRVMVCCNETPENLSVIPPLEEGIEDKIILLRVKAIIPPMPAQRVEEKKEFSNAIKRELPAFLHFLQSFETPQQLQDSRDGVKAWKDADLLQAITEISPEARLEALILTSLEKGYINVPKEETEYMSATEIQEKLFERDSPTSEQAKSLLRYDSNCGNYLGRLMKNGSEVVLTKKIVKGITKYEIKNTAA